LTSISAEACRDDGPATTAAAPAPTGSPSIGTARMADGTTLRTLHWEAAGDPWAAAQIVHGLGEHAGRYQSVAAPMTAEGIDTWAYDHRGNGGSGGRRGWVDRWSILHDDLEARLGSLRDVHTGGPVVLYGHSMGGLIAAGYVLSDQPRLMPDLLVLSAPGLDDNLPATTKKLAGLLNALVPKMRVANGVPDGGLSRDPSVEASVASDPLASGKSTVRFGAEGLAEQVRVREALARLDEMPMPTLVFQGSADPVVPVTASARFEGKGNVTVRVYDGLRHECHHEPEHADVLADVVAWIRANAPADEAPGPV
jgi:acylglycerol lipase